MKEKEKVEQIKKMICKTYWGFRFMESRSYKEWIDPNEMINDRKVFVIMFEQRYRLN